MNRLLLLLAIYFLAFVTAENRFLYDGYKVFRVFPKTEAHMEILKNIHDDLKTYNFWTKPSNLNTPVDIMVAPHKQELFINNLIQNGIIPEIFINDVQKFIEATDRKSSPNARFSWVDYYNLTDIYEWVDSLASKYPKNVEVFTIGTTYEKREIKAIKISFGNPNRTVVIEGGIHAREWITPATVTYIINEILNGSDPVWGKISKGFDWYIVPVANPDGHDYTHKVNRLWRKNRVPFGNCEGVDLNRNYDITWGLTGTSTNTCEETYGGPNAFSELETQAMSKLIKSVSSNLKVFLAIHSYGQQLLLPYGHTPEHLDNYDDAMAVGKSAIDALSKKYGTKYALGNTAEVLYLASGTTSDWAKNTTKVPLSYTYEVRDTGKFGFLLPPEEIIPNCLEIMDSLVAMFQTAEKMHLFD